MAQSFSAVGTSFFDQNWMIGLFIRMHHGLPCSVDVSGAVREYLARTNKVVLSGKGRDIFVQPDIFCADPRDRYAGNVYLQSVD
jgi:hypothetical protein